MNFICKKGITLLELMIVVAIIGILSVITFSEFSKVKERQVLKSTVGNVVSIINKAKAQTLASLNLDTYGVHFDSDKIVLFSGTTYDVNHSSNEIINISSPVRISSISFVGGGNDFYFNKLTGSPSKTGVITISLNSDPSINKELTISATGSVSSN